jgi:hypothetical protein
MVPTGRAAVVMEGGADNVATVPPKLPAAPTATQFAAPAHDAPSREATPAGARSTVELAQPFEVLMMLAPPTAVHVEELMQLIAARGVPAGLPNGRQVDPPSVVPTSSDPEVKHVVLETHEIPVSEVTPVGTDWGDHVVPPFDVEMIAGPGPSDDVPIAVQWRLSGQAMPLKLVIVAGIGSGDQVAPPFVVPMMLGAALFESNSLTA